MPHSLRSFLYTALIFAPACSGRSPAEPLPDDPIGHVRAVVGGRVLDASGNPVKGALVNVTVRCLSEVHECSIGTSTATDQAGRFVIGLDQELGYEFPVKTEVQAWPPLGMGYVLGTAIVEDVDAAFQRTPVADTTFVDVFLPRDSVDSRRPVRIEDVGHRTSDLRLDSNRLYLSSPGGVAAMDPATGEWLWEEGSTASLAGPPYILDGEVVVMAHGTTLTALRAVDGEVLWSRDGVLTRSLTAGKGGEFFASDGPVVAAYDLESGATRWTHELIGNGNVVIAAGENLVCAEILAFVECWEPSTGDLVWSRPTEFANWLAIVGDRVILGAQSGWSAFDRETGAELWRTAVTTFNSPALVEDGDFMFACSAAECMAVRMSDGAVAWRTSIPDPASPATDGRSVYVVGWLEDSSSLYVLDAATGAIRERILPDPFDGGFGGTPVVGRDLVFVFGSGHLYAFEKL